MPTTPTPSKKLSKKFSPWHAQGAVQQRIMRMSAIKGLREETVARPVAHQDLVNFFGHPLQDKNKEEGLKRLQRRQYAWQVKKILQEHPTLSLLWESTPGGWVRTEALAYPWEQPDHLDIGILASRGFTPTPLL